MPIISDKHGYLFVLSPRTGSSAIAEGVLIPALDGRWLPDEDVTADDGTTVLLDAKHAPVKDLRRHGLLSRHDTQRLFTFSAVRNPFDSMASLYVKQQQTYQPLLDDPGSWIHRRPHYVRAMTYAAEHTFGEWFRHVLRPRNRRQQLYARLRGQYYPRHLYRAHIAGMDLVMRHESLQEDFNRVLDRLRLERATIPRVNVTKERSTGYQDFYDGPTQQLAEHIFAPDMQKFGYTFA